MSLDEYFEEVINGVNMFWNNKFQDAETYFSGKKEVYPRHALHFAEANLLVHLIHLTNYKLDQKQTVFLKYFITSDAEDAALAVRRLEAASKLAKSCIDSPTKMVSGKYVALVYHCPFPIFRMFF